MSDDYLTRSPEEQQRIDAGHARRWRPLGPRDDPAMDDERDLEPVEQPDAGELRGGE